MFDFVICDDQELFLKNIQEYTNKIIESNKINGKINLCTTNPKEVFKYTKNKTSKNISIYFLDIDFNNININGLNLASLIRKYDPNAYIIFITSHPELSMNTFELNLKAFHYLIKPIDYQKLEKTINNIINDYNNILNNHNIILIKNGIVEKKYNINDIIFFESYKQIIVAHIIIDNNYHKIEFRSSLKDIKNQFDDIFFKCHNSYLININKIKEIQNSKIIMEKNIECPLSRKYKKIIKDNFYKGAIKI